MSAKSDPSESQAAAGGGGEPGPKRKMTLSERLREFVHAVREGDEAMVEDIVLRLSESRRVVAPLAFVVGGFAMLLTG